MVIPPMKAWALSQPFIANAISGALFGLGASTSIYLAHDRWFADFDDHHLTRLTRPDLNRRAPQENDEPAPEYQLPWRNPKRGERLDLWNDIMAWARAESAEPSRLWPWSPLRAKLLSINFLTGRAGGGKTRLAIEIGRALANRKDHGDHARRHSPKLGTWSRWLEWLRTQAFFLERREGDAWDAAWVRAKGATAFSDLVSRLEKEWRPRRPTFLILDDPGPGDVNSLRDALVKSSEHWRHPVRLLVINQSIPVELGLLWDARRGGWVQSGGEQLIPQPFVMRETAWFTDAEIAGFLSDPSLTSIQVQALIRQPGSIERAVAVTRRNPLLVALAVTWLREGASLADMTSQELLKARAERVIRALISADVTGQGAYEALAVATLVGGAGRMALEKALGHRDAPIASKLRAIFPADDEAFGERIPPFRPELVGDAVARRLIQELGGEYAGRIVTAAWKLDAPRMLRLRRRPRVADDPYNHGRPDPLSTAIRDIDPSTITDVTRLDLVFADLEVGLYEDREEAYFGSRPDRRADILALIHGIRALDPDGARQVSAELRRRLDDIAGERRKGLRVDAFVGSFLATFDGPGRVNTDNADQVLTQIEALIGALPDLNSWIDSAVMAEAAKSLLAALTQAITEGPPEDRLETLADQFWTIKLQWPVLAGAGLHALAERCRTDESAVYWAYASQVLLALGEPPSVSILGFGRSDLKSKALMAAAFGQAGRGAGAGGVDAERLALEVGGIAGRFPKSEAIQKVRAETLSYAAYARAQHDAGAAEAERFAREVGGIADRFPESEAIQRLHAQALGHAAYGQARRDAGAGAVDAERLAREVGGVAGSFPENEAIQSEHARALKYAVDGQAGRDTDAGAVEAERLAREVGGIADRFPENEVIQQERVQALRLAAHGRSRRDAGAGAVDAERLAREVGGVAGRFPENEAIQLEHASALRHAAYGQAGRGAGVGAAEAARLACEVGGIAARFPKNEAIHREHAEALRFAGYGQAQRDAGAGAAEAERLAREVGGIADRFPKNEAIHREHAEALSYAAHGPAVRGAGAGAMEAERLAREVGGIAARFPKNEAIQRVHVRALSYAAYGQDQREAGTGAADAERLMREAVGIAKRFPENEAIQSEYASGQRYLAYGRALRGACNPASPHDG